MKKIICFAYIIFIYFISWAQPYIPVLQLGKTWRTETPKGLGNFRIDFQKLACDTTINSLNYYELFVCDTFGTVNSAAWAAVREDTSTHKVYLFNYSNGIETMILDFDIPIGGSYLGLTVDSISNNNIFGQIRKVIYFNYPNFRWIEGIGNSYNGLQDGTLAFARLTDLYLTNDLCWPVSLPHSLSASEIIIKQNSSTIYFELPYISACQVVIRNLYGQKILENKFNASKLFNLSYLDTGIYIIEVYADRSKIVKKVFIP